jgi:hypothetical protein
MKNSRLDALIRSHEPENKGYKSFFGGRLHTIFSTGGKGNPDTAYWTEGSWLNVDSPQTGCIT